MDKATLYKRIAETKTEIFLLDRLLPLDSVYTIFHNEYEKKESKTVFLNNRIYSRLREGYYALFSTLAYSLNTDKQHVIYFPSDPSNDFYMVELNRNKEGTAYCFDVKEYTAHSKSFELFLEEAVFPRIENDTYDLVIGLHKAVSPSEQKLIYDYLKNNDSFRIIYLIGAASEDSDNEDIARVICITKDGIIQNLVIDLAMHLKKLDAILVFQDLVKLKKARRISS